jgi:hypothetical protein
LISFRLLDSPNSALAASANVVTTLISLTR